jgi:hypothetical protein
MARTDIKGLIGQIVTHSSDGKDGPQPSSAGQPIAVIGSVLAKTIQVHGQETGTTVVFDNPA